MPKGTVPQKIILILFVIFSPDGAFVANFRGRKLFGNQFTLPDDVGAYVMSCEEHLLDEEPAPVCNVIHVSKILVWNTDAPCDAEEKLHTSLLWMKLNSAMSKD
uniref:Ribonuclease H2 non-catalytic subunit (Ylr154p-like) n=1 Tax=Schistocephalus solidus TaxID=70667 RepID=A0A0X3NG71_SCHSO